MFCRGLNTRHKFKSDIYEFCYRYTIFRQWCGFPSSIGNSTENTNEPWILVRMHMVNERYQQNSQKWQIWQLVFQWHRIGIEIREVFKSLPILWSTDVGVTWKPIGGGDLKDVFVFCTSPGWTFFCRGALSSNDFTTWCRTLIKAAEVMSAFNVTLVSL